MSNFRAAAWIAALVLLDQLGAGLITYLRPEWVNLDGQQFIRVVPAAVSWIIAIPILASLHRLRWPFVLMAGGLISNALSFLVYGHFIDILPLQFFYSSTADLLVTAGCLGAVFSL